MTVLSKLKRANKKAYRNNRRKRREEKKKEPKGDKLVLLIRLSQFGSLTKYNITQLYEQEGDSLLLELIEEGYVKKGEKDVRVNKEKVSHFRLTTKGQKLVKEKGYKLYYSNSPRHDIIHATNVIEQFKDYLDHYKHEKELPDAKARDCSKVDGAIFLDDSIIYLETITRNYKKDKINAKRRYADLYSNKAKYSYIEFNE